MKYKFVPSIIAKNQNEFEERFDKVKDISKFYQLDIMDGKFVKNKSLLFDFILPTDDKLLYEIHLMLEEKGLKIWLNQNIRKFSGNDIFIIQAETRNFEKYIRELKNEKLRVGLALNPDTSVEKIKNLIKEIDLVLIMTVNPGKYGAKLLPSTLKKVKEIRKLNHKIDIEVDGSVNEETVLDMKDAGANRFVLGSYLQDSGDVKESWKAIKKVAS